MSSTRYYLVIFLLLLFMIINIANTVSSYKAFGSYQPDDESVNQPGDREEGKLLFSDDSIRYIVNKLLFNLGYDFLLTRTNEVYWQDQVNFGYNTISEYDYVFGAGHGGKGLIDAMEGISEDNDDLVIYVYEMHGENRIKWIFFITCKTGYAGTSTYYNLYYHYLFDIDNPRDVALHGALGFATDIYDHFVVTNYQGEVLDFITTRHNFTEKFINWAIGGSRIYDAWYLAVVSYDMDIEDVNTDYGAQLNKVKGTALYVVIDALIEYEDPRHPYYEQIHFCYNREWLAGVDPSSPFPKPGDYYRTIEELDELPFIDVIYLSMTIYYEVFWW